MRKIILPLILCSFICHAQTINIDSLKKLVTHTNSEIAQINALRELGFYYWERNPDSSIFYSQQLVDLGKKQIMSGPRQWVIPVWAGLTTTRSIMEWL